MTTTHSGRLAFHIYLFYNNLASTVNGITYTQPGTENTLVVGRATGAKTKVLMEVARSYTWLRSVSYYDDKYRVIQTIADNYKGAATLFPTSMTLLEKF